MTNLEIPQNQMENKYQEFAGTAGLVHVALEDKLAKLKQSELTASDQEKEKLQEQINDVISMKTVFEKEMGFLPHELIVTDQHRTNKATEAAFQRSFRKRKLKEKSLAAAEKAVRAIIAKKDQEAKTSRSLKEKIAAQKVIAFIEKLKAEEQKEQSE